MSNRRPRKTSRPCNQEKSRRATTLRAQFWNKIIPAENKKCLQSVYQLTSPHLPGNAYIGSSKDVAARFQQHKNQRRTAGALFDAGDVALEVLGEFEVETRCEQCRIEGRFQQESEGEKMMKMMR